jgi:hypothetical protein
MEAKMSGAAWQTEYSVKTSASREFAWAYMSDVSNWDDPPAQFVLDRRFASGARGTTRMPGQSPRDWQLRDVTPVESYTIEFLLDGAILSFEWGFKELPGGGAMLTQHIELTGENALAFQADIQKMFAAGLAPGMTRIAEAMDRAYEAGH